MTRKHLATVASIGVIALVVAGCGSSGGGNSSASSTPAAAATSNTLNGTNTSLGKIITNGQGRTLYLFAKDTGPMSTCSGACANFWPPFLATKKPAAGGGVSAGAITLVKRSDGKSQVVLDGHPLYFFAGDQGPGQTNGQGVNEFGAKWFTVAPSGMSVTAAAKSSGAGSSGGGGYSY